MAKKQLQKRTIDNFDFLIGRRLIRKYDVVSRLGDGWEGEVFLLRECDTDIERAAKFFYPHRNINNRALKFYAKKLHILRHCSIMIPYHTQETIYAKGCQVNFLVSDYVEGELLSEFLNRQPGKRLHTCQALQLLHALAQGFDEIHRLQEYHGDLHSENIIVQRYGLGFDLQLLDLYHWHAPKKVNIQEDICDMIRIFYDALGGQKRYAKLPPEVKAICCGLKKSLILKRFKTSGMICHHLETLHWG
jgi:serine/threonine protein kinase